MRSRHRDLNKSQIECASYWMKIEQPEEIPFHCLQRPSEGAAHNPNAIQLSDRVPDRFRSQGLISESAKRNQVPKTIFFLL